MKKFSIRKKLLAILISSNIMLTGCSITGEITSKKQNNSDDSSYTQSSIDENANILESSIEDDSNIENSSSHNKQTSTESKDETKELVENSIESKTEETSTKVDESESIIEEESKESSVEEISNTESSIIKENDEESYKDSVEEYNNKIYTDDNTYVRAKTTVNVRSEPNTNSNVLLLLYEGNMLKKIGYVDDWYIVEYEGYNAYVSKDYTEEIGESELNIDLNESNICYFPYGSTLYSDKELTNKILEIPSLESGQIFNQEGNAFYVETNGYNGYVNIYTATIIPQPVVIVDKSEQTLRLYKNNNKVMEFPVVTGNEDPNFYHPSDEGLFNIYSKSYNANLVGDTWDVVVNVFMGYNGGEGIHDATWRADYEFGGTTYQWNGSHGCINCPYNEVMDLANEVEVGDKVLVKDKNNKEDVKLVASSLFDI